MSAAILPGDKMQVFAFDDDYSFGVLQSRPHLIWYQAKSARLKNEVDYNYSAESVFDTFPWPQVPSQQSVKTVAMAAREVLHIRKEVTPKLKGGLRALYYTLELPGANPLKEAHAVLDTAVTEAYGFSKTGNLLGQLLELNRSVASKIDHDQRVTSPGIPGDFPDPESLISPDCICPMVR
jgi:hypothetical protein